MIVFQRWRHVFQQSVKAVALFVHLCSHFVHTLFTFFAFKRFLFRVYPQWGKESQNTAEIFSGALSTPDTFLCPGKTRIPFCILQRRAQAFDFILYVFLISSDTPSCWVLKCWCPSLRNCITLVRLCVDEGSEVLWTRSWTGVSLSSWLKLFCLIVPWMTFIFKWQHLLLLLLIMVG